MFILYLTTQTLKIIWRLTIKFSNLNKNEKTTTIYKRYIRSTKES